MVIGPTPPGTGVIAAATSLALGEVDVADQAALAVVVGMRLMPTSITVAPGLSQSPRTIFGAADRGDDDVGAADDAGRSRVRRWAMVTVQLSPSSSCAIGLPTMFERPITTASCAGEVAELGLEQHAGSRAACRGRSRGKPDREPAGIDRVEAVDVLVGVDRVMTALASICAGSGSWTRMPSTARSALSRRPGRAARASLSRVGQLVLEALHAGFARRLALGADIDRAGRDPRRPAPRRGRARGRCGSELGDLAATRSRRARPRRPSRRSAVRSYARIDRGSHRAPSSSMRRIWISEQDDQRREIDPAEIGHDLADRPVERRGHPVERVERTSGRSRELVLMTLNATSQLRMTWAMMIQPSDAEQHVDDVEEGDRAWRAA